MTAISPAKPPIAAAMRLALVAAFTLAASPSFAITIDGESRLTEEQFAKKNGQPVADVKKTFAASGMLECMSTQRRGRMIRRLTVRLTAQLTGKSDIIVTAAHGFIDTQTCEKRMHPSQCSFKANDGRHSVAREVKLVAIGKVRCEAGIPKGADDWAVLKLATPIATIAPYRLGRWNSNGSVTNVGVLSVSAQSQDFYLNGAPKPDLKTIDDCVIKSFSVWGTAAMLGTNCDISMGSSGGALLVKGLSGAHELLGISTAFSVPGSSKKTRNAAYDGAYNDRTWRAYAVPLTGAFRAALELATGQEMSIQGPVFPLVGTTVSAPFMDNFTPPPLARGNPFPPVPHPCEDGTCPGDCPKP